MSAPFVTMAVGPFEAQTEKKVDLPPQSLNTFRQLQSTSALTLTATQRYSQELPQPELKQKPTPPPQSKWDQLHAQLREKPVDADGWLKLVDFAEDADDMEKIKETYQGMLETYPNTVRISWVFVVDVHPV